MENPLVASWKMEDPLVIGDPPLLGPWPLGSSVQCVYSLQAWKDQPRGFGCSWQGGSRRFLVPSFPNPRLLPAADSRELCRNSCLGGDPSAAPWHKLNSKLP